MAGNTWPDRRDARQAAQTGSGLCREGNPLAGFEIGLQAGQNLGPAGSDAGGAFGQLVMLERQLAGLAERLDDPGDFQAFIPVPLHSGRKVVTSRRGLSTSSTSPSTANPPSG